MPGEKISAEFAKFDNLRRCRSGRFQTAMRAIKSAISATPVPARRLAKTKVAYHRIKLIAHPIPTLAGTVMTPMRLRMHASPAIMRNSIGKIAG